jgi:O-antigen/teichoic acid export membrane protein
MKKSDIYNLLSLILVQASNALVPLIVFPFALKILGAEPYSNLVMTEAVAVFVTALVLYSFEIDGPGKIIGLQWPGEIDKISKYFSIIFYTRIVIFIISSVIVLFSTWLLFDSKITKLMMFWMMVPLSYALQPNWLFQALEKNQIFALIFLVSRVVCLVLIFLFITDPKDVFLVPLIIGGCYLICAVISVSYAVYALGLKFQARPAQELLHAIADGYHIFFGNLAVTLYKDLNVIILGVIGGTATMISAYSLAEKIIKGFQAAMRPIGQYFLPKTLLIIKNSVNAGRIDLKKIWPLLYPQLATLLVFIGLALLIYKYIFYAIGIENNWSNSGLVMVLFLLMIPSAFFGIANFVLGVLTLNFLGQQRYMMNAILFVGLASVFLGFGLGKQFEAFGVAISFSLSEALLFILIVFKHYSMRH